MFGGGEPGFDGFERNEKKEEERAGVEDGVDAEGEWLIDGRGIPEDPLLVVVVVPEQDGVVTIAGCSADDLCALNPRPATMGVKSLWKLLTPVGRPVLYFFFIALFLQDFADFLPKA